MATIGFSRGSLWYLLPVLAGVIGGIALLVPYRDRLGYDYQHLALGKDAMPWFATLDGHPIHCMYVEDGAACRGAWRRRGGRPVVLWLGNSQLHGINQYRQGQVTATALLQPRLAGLGLDLLTFSQPNANFQEHLVMFQYLRQRLPLAALVLPLVFDDLRESGLRSGVAAALSDPPTRGVLAASATGERLLRLDAQSRAEAANTAPGATRRTPQEISEAFLDGWLEEHVTLWALRPGIRGALFNALYEARNRMFDITSQTRRAMIPARRVVNMAALEDILETAARHQVPVLTYVAPLRSDVPTPYIEQEYREFKTAAQELARAHGARFVNLEVLVPGALWGTIISPDLRAEAAIDFMHFQAEGHRLMAQALERHLAELAP